MADKHGAGRENKSVPPGWPRWRHCSKSADSNSSYAKRTIFPYPPIPASSSRTVTKRKRCQKGVKKVSVPAIVELALILSNNWPPYVIDRPGILQSQFARHAPSL